MRRLSFVLAIATLSVARVTAFDGARGRRLPRSGRSGALFAFSGPLAFLGQEAFRGAEIASQIINEQGGHRTACSFTGTRRMRRRQRKRAAKPSVSQGNGLAYKFEVYLGALGSSPHSGAAKEFSEPGSGRTRSRPAVTKGHGAGRPAVGLHVGRLRHRQADARPWQNRHYGQDRDQAQRCAFGNSISALSIELPNAPSSYLIAILTVVTVLPRTGVSLSVTKSANV